MQQYLHLRSEVDSASYGTLQLPICRLLADGVSGSIWHNFELDRIGWQWRRVAMGMQEWSGFKDCVSVVMQIQAMMLST